MFSVVIPLYNKEKYIVRAIKSVLDQRFKDLELIIVDDGSTDNSVREISNFDDSRIRVIHQENMGVASARNRGVQEAKFELIAFLDADDEWKPEFLNTIYSMTLNYSVCSVFSTNYIIRDEITDEERHISINGLPNGFTTGVIEDYFYIAAQSDPIICSSSVVIKKQALQFVGGFPVGIVSGEDLLTWAKLANSFLVAFSLEPLSIFHSLNRGLSERRENDSSDFVGDYLLSMSRKEEDKARSLRSYLGYWLNVRTSIFLEVGDTRNARNSAIKALKNSGINLKILIFFTLSCLPSSLSIKLYHILRSQRKRKH